MASGESPGETAKGVIECNAALVEISNSFEDDEHQEEVIDVEVIPTDEWADEKWNSYRLKDALRETAADAARVALHNAADDLSVKIMQYGIDSVLGDKSIIADSFLYAADSGLKVATAGAVRVAADRQVFYLPPKAAHAETIANIASLAVENMQILSQVGSGEISSTEGMVMMKNNTMVTVANTFGQKQGASIGASIGTAFGPVGTAVSGFIGGAVGKYVGTEIGLDIVSGNSKILNVAKKAVSAVGNVVKSVGNTIKNLFNNLF